jgi:hypothetical protein
MSRGEKTCGIGEAFGIAKRAVAWNRRELPGEVATLFFQG